MDRAAVLLKGFNREEHVGVEIGPFFSPIAPKSEGWKTTVIDAYDSATLRDMAANHSSVEIRDRESSIEDVDVVWNGEFLGSVAELVSLAPVDYVIASHVIEHVPDLVEFLRGVSALLGQGGILSLAVPDSRFCFDALRPVSLVSDALQAHRERRTKHSPETVFEQIAYGLYIEGHSAWTKSAAGVASLMSGFDWARDQYQEFIRRCAENPDYYMDCHAWVFTPNSFELMVLELGLMGLTDLRVLEVDHRTLASEFFVRLGRSDDIGISSNVDDKRLELLLKVRAEVSGVIYRAEGPSAGES